MALPAHRVIGHKEYGNVGHPGRKSDPVYDMNWRRARVAAFTPGVQEDDMQIDERFELHGIPGTITVREALTGAFMAGQGWVDVLDAKGKPTGRKINLPLFLAWYDNNQAVLRGEVAALRELVRTALSEAGTGRGSEGIDVEALMSRIDDAVDAGVQRGLAEGVDVRATISVGDDDKTP